MRSFIHDDPELREFARKLSHEGKLEDIKSILITHGVQNPDEIMPDIVELLKPPFPTLSEGHFVIKD